jgi:hypothetical protein
MALSATQDALDSLVCSTFFNPGVPCSLVGAASLGISEALLPADGCGFSKLLQAIAVNRSCMSLLWHALVNSHQAPRFLTLALKQLPPICLPAAFWTNTKQSFVQEKYDSDYLRNDTISCADEFIHSYYCRSEVLVPRSPVPPFGSTCTKNLSFEVRLHYLHSHTPCSWKSYWVQLSGARVPASARYQIKASPPVQIQYFETTKNKVLKEYVS